jgi:hypothetical protein
MIIPIFFCHHCADQQLGGFQSDGGTFLQYLLGGLIEIQGVLIHPFQDLVGGLADSVIPEGPPEGS